MAALLTPAEAAEYLGSGMTETRIRAMARRGDIAYRRDGRFMRFALSDLEDYVASIAKPRRQQRTRDKGRRTA
jgi:excisionase family DNA binding protein